MVGWKRGMYHRGPYKKTCSWHGTGVTGRCENIASTHQKTSHVQYNRKGLLQIHQREINLDTNVTEIWCFGLI